MEGADSDQDVQTTCLRIRASCESSWEDVYHKSVAGTGELCVCEQLILEILVPFSERWVVHELLARTEALTRLGPIDTPALIEWILGIGYLAPIVVAGIGVIEVVAGPVGLTAIGDVADSVAKLVKEGGIAVENGRLL